MKYLLSLRFWVALLLAGLCAGAQAADISLPKGPGVNVVYAKCQTCHDLQYVVDSRGLLPAQWASVIASMRDYGLDATPDERKTILKYLETYMGPNPPPAASQAADQQGAAVSGARVFAQNCSGCHGVAGKGQPGYFPPLAGNGDILKDRMFPVLVVLHGISGPIDVSGQKFDGAMPAFDHLSDADIAAVVNHVRSSWGNNTSMAPIEPAQVKQVRGHAMTAADVRRYRSKVTQ